MLIIDRSILLIVSLFLLVVLLLLLPIADFIRAKSPSHDRPVHSAGHGPGWPSGFHFDIRSAAAAGKTIIFHSDSSIVAPGD